MSDEYYGMQENEKPVTDNAAPVGEVTDTANDVSPIADDSFAVNNPGPAAAPDNNAAENNAVPPVDNSFNSAANNNENNNSNLNNNNSNNYNNANNNQNYGFYNTNGVQAYAPIRKIDNNMEEPLSIGEWALTLILLMIPVVGLVMCIVWACGAGHNISRRNYARALLIIRIVAFVLVVFFVAVVIIAASAMGYSFYIPF